MSCEETTMESKTSDFNETGSRKMRSRCWPQVLKYIVTFISAVVVPPMIDLFLDAGEDGDEAIMCILFGLPFFLTLGAVLGHLISEMILLKSARDREERGSGGGLKFILTVLGALGLPMAIGRFFGPDPANSMAGLLSSTALGAAIGYLICEMILLKSGRVRKLGWKGLVISVAVILVVVGACRLNETRNVHLVPDPAEVESAEVQIFLELKTTLADPDAIKELTDIHRDLIEAQEPGITGYSGRDVQITYHLKNGKTLMRSYWVPYDESRNGNADERLFRLAERGEMVDWTLESYHELKDSPLIDTVILWSEPAPGETDEDKFTGKRVKIELEEEDALDLYENGILPDLEAGVFPHSFDDDMRTPSDARIEFYPWWKDDREDTDSQTTRFVCQALIYVLSPDCTHTLAWLTAHGYDIPGLE